MPCASDGAPYVVRGHLVGPRRALYARGPRTVTLYLHGYNTGEWNWRLQVRGYDTAVDLAKLGHVSLTIDRLGYGSSGHPQGFMSCLGAQADVTHQIIQDLRAGSYTVAAGRPITFKKVVLAGHDIGGTIAEIEAYSYKDIDGLMVMGIDDSATGYNTQVYVWFGDAARICATGGQNAEPGGPGGYARFIQSDEDRRRYAFPNSEPAVINASLQLANKNPCGDFYSTSTAIDVDQTRLSEIKVPVLLLYTEKDLIVNRAGAEQQRSLYTGTKDVTFIDMPNTGHFPMLERTAPTFRATLSDWLNHHSFVTRTYTGTRQAKP